MANSNYHTTHQATQAPQVAPAHRISEQRPYQAPDFDYAHWKVLRDQFGASHMIPQHARVVSKVPSREMPEVKRLRPHRVEAEVEVPASPVWVEDTQWDEATQWYVDGSASQEGSEASEVKKGKESVVEMGMEGDGEGGLGEEDVRLPSPALADRKRKRESSGGVQWVEDTYWDAPSFKRCFTTRQTVDLTGDEEMEVEIIDLTGEA